MICTVLNRKYKDKSNKQICENIRQICNHVFSLSKKNLSEKNKEKMSSCDCAKDKRRRKQHFMFLLLFSYCLTTLNKINTSLNYVSQVQWKSRLIFVLLLRKLCALLNKTKDETFNCQSKSWKQNFFWSEVNNTRLTKFKGSNKFENWTYITGPTKTRPKLAPLTRALWMKRNRG